MLATLHSRWSNAEMVSPRIAVSLAFVAVALASCSSVAAVGDGGRVPQGDRWSGYIESFTFPSTSDRVRVEFDRASGDGPRTGIVVFGAGTAPPAATDPSMGYPPGENVETIERRPLVIEGFVYPIARATVTGSRVQVTLNLASVWADWCALQTPYSNNADSFRCVQSYPTRGGDTCALLPPGGMEIPVDCVKLRLCQTTVCSCDAMHCSAGSIGEVTFDFAANGDAGEGTVVLDGATTRNVHLMRGQ